MSGLINATNQSFLPTPIDQIRGHAKQSAAKVLSDEGFPDWGGHRDL